MRRAEIEPLLPQVFQQVAGPGTPLRAILGVMETLHERDEALLDGIDAVFDPQRAADDAVALLAYWVALEPWMAATPACLRRLVAAGAELVRWRGTRRGLQRFLELATGVEGIRVEEGGPDAEPPTAPFHLRIRGPVAAEPHRPLLERLIEREKPAYTTCDLGFE